jgi:hypothetical protein
VKFLSHCRLVVESPLMGEVSCDGVRGLSAPRDLASPRKCKRRDSSFTIVNEPQAPTTPPDALHESRCATTLHLHNVLYHIYRQKEGLGSTNFPPARQTQSAQRNHQFVPPRLTTCDVTDAIQALRSTISSNQHHRNRKNERYGHKEGRMMTVRRLYWLENTSQKGPLTRSLGADEKSLLSILTRH